MVLPSYFRVERFKRDVHPARCAGLCTAALALVSEHLAGWRIPLQAWLLGSVGQKTRCCCFKSLREFGNDSDRRVPHLPFDAGDIGPVYLRTIGKLLLRKVQPLPGCLDVSSEYRAHVFHGHDRQEMKTIRPRTMSLIFCFHRRFVDYRLHRTLSGWCDVRCRCLRVFVAGADRLRRSEACATRQPSFATTERRILTFPSFAT